MIVDQQNTARSHDIFFIPNVYVCVNSHVDIRKDKSKIIILKVNK